jgi:hypothetical protein
MIDDAHISPGGTYDHHARRADGPGHGSRPRYRPRDRDRPRPTGARGVTVNVYRPGTADTSTQAYIRAQPREQIGASLDDQFTGMLSSGALITPHSSAESLLARLPGPQSGQIWSVSDPIPDQQN